MWHKLPIASITLFSGLRTAFQDLNWSIYSYTTSSREWSCNKAFSGVLQTEIVLTVQLSLAQLVDCEDSKGLLEIIVVWSYKAQNGVAAANGDIRPLKKPDAY